MTSRRSMFAPPIAAGVCGTLGYIYSRMQALAPIAAPNREPETRHIDVPTVSLVSASGQQVKLSTIMRSDELLALYAVRSTCSWCTKNRLAVNSAAEQLRGRVRFIAVGLDREWPAPSAYLFPTYLLADAATSAPWIRATPSTTIMNIDGQLYAHLEGAYTGQVRQRLIKLFGVSLAESL